MSVSNTGVRRLSPGPGQAKRLSRRRVLLCVADERPHLVTQALCALASRGKGWYPGEVIAVMTQRGAEELHARLVRQPRFDTLCREILPPDLARPQLGVEVVRAEIGRSPRCIATAHTLHRRELSNCILRTVQRVTQDADTELCVMLGPQGPVLNSFVAGHTLSLLGRPQDWLAQIVVSDDDARGDFFYPNPSERAAQSRVGLLEIPFARVESVASVRQLVDQADYSALCHGLDGHAHLQVQQHFAGLNFRFSNAFDIRCDSSHRAGGPRIEPRAAALYALYAQRASRGAPFVSDEQLLDVPQEYLELYDACLLGGDTKVAGLAAGGLTRAALCAARSRIARALMGLIRQGASYSDYRIYRQKCGASYGLNLAAEQVSVVTA